MPIFSKATALAAAAAAGASISAAAASLGYTKIMNPNLTSNPNPTFPSSPNLNLYSHMAKAKASANAMPIPMPWVAVAEAADCANANANATDKDTSTSTTHTENVNFANAKPAPAVLANLGLGRLLSRGSTSTTTTESECGSKTAAAASASATITADKMPMPMDSAEGLAEFATPISDNNGNSPATATIPIAANLPKEKPVEVEGWYKKYCRWTPTSPALLEQAEKKVLSYIKTVYKGTFVDIGSVPKANCKWSPYSAKSEERKIWTVVFNGDEGQNETNTATATPLVMIHGLCASLGLWALNMDALASDRPVYAIDLLGFGRSSRPRFSNDPSEAEAQHVEAIESWRKEMKLERFVLLGHSMGGFLSTAYALKYPERVAHLVLADPWGFPKKPENVEEILPINKSFATKAITTIGQRVNALAVVRAAGPYGPGLIDRVRPDLVHKFEALNQNGTASVGEYIYHCNAQKPTGEEAFRTMMDFFGWAKNPMCDRLHQIKPEVPLTMIYGERTWLQQIPPETIQQMRPPGAHVNVVTIPEAGHHVYADNQKLFNSIVNKASEFADKYLRR